MFTPQEWNRLLELEVDNLRSLNEGISQDIDKIDLLRDEFQRIKACPGATTEIIGLCERALSDIKQKVPVIEQRDALREKVDRLEQDQIAHLDALKRLWTFLDDLSKSNPGYLGKLVLQDYGAMNEAFIAARQALAKAKLL